MSRVLWIDDNPDMVASVKADLIASGIDVEWTDGATLEDWSIPDFDLLIVDLSLSWRTDDRRGQQDTSGLQLLRYLYEQPESKVAIDSRTTKVLVLSQHLAESSWRLALTQFGRETGIHAMLRSKYGFRDLDVDLPGGASMRGYLVQVIKEAAGIDSVTLLTEEISEAAYRPDIDPFRVGFSEFVEMTDMEKATIQEAAFDRLETRAEQIFETEGSDWLVFCGTPDQPYSAGRGSPPAPQELRDIASERGYPTFVILRSYAGVSAGSFVEEIEPPPRRGRFRRRSDSRPDVGDFIFRCGGDLQDYPTVTMELGRRIRTFHFDTGSSESWLRASDVREHGIELDVLDRRMVRGKRGRYYVYPLDGGVHCTLLDQGSEATIGVVVRGSAIEDPEKWEFARFCKDHGCHHEGTAKNGECIVRSGVAGRSLIADNELAVTIYSNSDATHVMRLQRR